MISKATDVSAYIAELDGERRAPIMRLRTLCKQVLKGFEECMQYGMPCYRRNGTVEISFASQKQYIALYVLQKDVLDQFRSQLPKAGKGCVRFTNAEKIDFAVVKQLLTKAAQSKAKPC